MKKKSLSVKKLIHKSFFNNLKNNKINKIFKEFNNYLNSNLKDKKKTKIRIGVALSGGPDSLALVFLTKCFLLLNKKIECHFFIVDHKLRKDSSIEANNIRLLLQKFNIKLNILKWIGKKPNSNIQGVARNYRYKLLKKVCKKKNINYLLIGHHLDDVYENFFIRLLRGSGLRGLASFGEIIEDKNYNIFVLRPLINFEKKELVYIKFFINDPYNKNISFQRTRVRNLILNLEKEGLSKEKLDLTIKNLQYANNAINFYVNKNIKNNSRLISQKKTYYLNKFFFKQSEEVVFRSVSIILQFISGRYYSPRGKSIQNMILKINSGKYKKFTLGGCFIEKVNETLLISKEI